MLILIPVFFLILWVEFYADGYLNWKHSRANVKECIRAGGGGKTRFLESGLTASWSDTLLLD